MSAGEKSFHALLPAIAVGVAAASPFLTMLFSATWTYEGRFITLMISAALLVWAAVLHPPETAPNGAPVSVWRRPLDISAAVLAGLVVVSALVSASPAEALTFGAERSLMGAPTWLAFLAIACAASRIQLTPTVHSATKPATLLAAVVAARILFERAQGSDIVAWFGNSNYAGMVVLMALPLGLASSRAAKTVGWRWSWFAVSVVIGSGAIASGSATVIAATVAVFAGALLMEPGLLGVSGDRGIRGARMVAIALLFMGLAVVLMALVSPSVLPDSLEEEIRGTTLFTRSEMWRVAIRVFSADPLLGAGPDGLMLASQPYLSLEQMRIEGAGGSGTGLLIRDPHALPLLLLASFGILGGTAFLVLMFVWVWGLRRAAAGADRSVRMAYALSFLGFLMCAMLIPWVVTMSALPMLMFGLAVGASWERAADARKRALKRTEPPFRRPAILTLAAAILVTLFFIAMAGSAFMGQSSLARFLRTYEEDAAAKMVAAQPTRSYLRYQSMLALGNGMVNGFVPFADFEGAVDEHYEGLENNAVYLANLGQRALDTAYLTGDERALQWGNQAARRAKGIAPNHPDVMLESAHAALLTGDLVRARRELDSFASLGLAYPTGLLYEHMYAVATDDDEAAVGFARMVRESAPYLAPFLTDGGQR